MDGDDAVEFFDEFAAEFEVDLAPLHRTWSTHFGPEGFPLSAGLIMAAISSSAALGLGLLTPLPEWLAFSLGVAVALGWLLGLRSWPLSRNRTLIAVTVGDLVRAARTGRWPEPSNPS